MPKQKQKTCKNKLCKKKFAPLRDMQCCCDYLCAIKYNQQTKDKKTKAKKVSRFRELKKLYDNHIPTLKKKAQKIFNKFIRLRDAKNNLPCISCNKPYDGAFDCGHFKPRGGNSSLAYNENNCHGQCRKCNRFLSANLVGYRINLIKKIGLNEVEVLESTNAIRKWKVEELQEIIREYTLKVKELEDE